MHCGFCDAGTDFSSFGTEIYADDHCAVLLHPDSSVAGHAMLVWRRHVENFSDLDPEEGAYFSDIQRAAESALLRETGRERAILLKLGIQTPHLHLHIYPVAATATRDDVMAAINATTREQRLQDFPERCRRSLTESLG